MRIVSGTAKGRVLLSPKTDRVIRPTADRVRQSLFDVLGQRCDGLRVLDLFAGTGALGLEAVSRGAASATLVDRDREAQELCRRNAAGLGFGERVEVLAMPVAAALELLARKGEPFDLVFVDPPYAQEAGTATLQALEARGLVAGGGRVLIEHAKAEVVTGVGALQPVDQRRFGETMVSIFRLTEP